MTGIILLTTVGDDAGPFNLYSNTSVPEFSVPFGDLYITAEQLLAGYVTDQIPDGTTTIRIKSINVNCTNYILKLHLLGGIIQFIYIKYA